MRPNDRGTLAFVLTVWALCGAAALLVRPLGGVASYGGLLLTVQVFLPGIVAVGFRLREPRPRFDRDGLRLGRVSDVMLAWLLPLLLVSLAFAATMELGLGRPDLSYAGVSAETLAAGGGGGEGYLVSSFAGGFLFFPFLTIPLSLGSELGWRSYLLPRLLDRGKWVALLGSGAAAGVAQVPVALLGQTEAPAAKILVLLLHHLAAGLLLGALYLRSRSLIIACLGHATLLCAARPFQLLLPQHDAILGSSTGLVGIAILAAAGSFLAARIRIGDLRDWREILPRTLWPEPEIPAHEPWVW